MHYAAAKGAPFEVIELLLNANTEAAAAADKARSSAPPPLPHQIYAPAFSLFFSPRLVALPDQCCAARLVLRPRSCPCTTLPPRARRSR